MNATRVIFVHITFCGMLNSLPLLAQNAPPPTPPLPPGFPAPKQIFDAPGLPNPIPPRPAPPPIIVQPQPAVVSPAVPVVSAPVVAAPAAPANPNALIWDSEFKETTTQPGDSDAHFTFWFTNNSANEVVINSVRTSCGCTTAKLPAMPWHVLPGTNGSLEVNVDLRGKSGVISKAVTVDSTAGIKSLIVKLTLPGAPAIGAFGQPVPVMNDADRLKNMQASLADRQVVFKDAACAKCHADPAKNVMDGYQVYAGVCRTCHESPQRAALVTDLRALKHETDIDYWKQWITYGRAGSMMPAFAQSEGGPLTPQQIDSLAAYCVKTFRPAITTLSSTNGAVTVFPLQKLN
jgi:mono/diheme cytochrome c family protein